MVFNKVSPQASKVKMIFLASIKILVVSLLLTACNSGSSAFDLTGEWSVKSEMSGSNSDYIQFNTDGTYREYTDKGEKAKGTWSFEDPTLKMTNEMGTFEYEITEKSNDKMTAKMKGFNLTLNFKRK